MGGAILRADIMYDNTGTLIAGSSSSRMRYQIKVFVKPKTTFYSQVVQRGSGKQGRTQRTVHQLFGPRIVFQVGGKLGEFQLNNMLVQLLTLLAVFAVTTIIVDLLMISALPRQQVYRQLKYDEEVVGADGQVYRVTPGEELVDDEREGLAGYRPVSMVSPEQTGGI